MKYCAFCGSANADEIAFCASCGNPFATEQNQSSNVKQAAPRVNQAQQFNQAPSVNRAPVSNPAPMQQNVGGNVNPSNNGAFVSADEHVVATLSNGMVANILSGEGLMNEEALLTNKRLYYTHKTGIINIRAKEEKVNVKDITGTKITNYNPIGIIVMAVLTLLIGIFCTVGNQDPVYLITFLPLTVVFLLFYFFFKKSFLKVEYAGGSISFSLKKYKKENIQSFQKSIYAVKDSLDAK